MEDPSASVQSVDQGNEGAAQQAIVEPSIQTDEEEYVEFPEAEPIAALDAKSVLEALHQLRVLYIRASKRAGAGLPATFVSQLMSGTLSLIDFAECKRVPYPESIKRKLAGSSVNPSRDAEALADKLERTSRTNSYLDYPVQVLVVGKPRVGKSELINSLLGRSAIYTHPMAQPNNRERIVKGRVHGVPFNFIELPGIRYEEDTASVHRAIAKHKPHVVLFVERADLGGPSDYDASVVGQLFGEGHVDAGRVMLVLTHAGEYMPDPVLVEEWHDLLESVLEGSPGGWCMAECHPSCPKSPDGQPMVLVSLAGMDGVETTGNSEVFENFKGLEVVEQPGLLAVPWKPALLLQMLQVSTLMVLGTIVQLSNKMRREDAKVPLRQLPPVEYYLEDMLDDCDEMPDPWDHQTVMECMEDPYDFLNPYNKHLLSKDMKRLREDEEDWAWGYEVQKRLFGPDQLYEDFDPAFNHVYLNVLRKAARDGNPLARREYDRYKMRYNSEIVDQLIFVEPEVWEMDYEAAKILQNLPLQDYVELRCKLGRVDSQEIVDILDRNAPAKYDYRRFIEKLSKPPGAGEEAAAPAATTSRTASSAVVAGSAPPTITTEAASTGPATPAARRPAPAVIYEDEEGEDEDEDEDMSEEETSEEEGTEVAAAEMDVMQGQYGDDDVGEMAADDGAADDDEAGPAMDEEGFMTGMKIAPEIDFGEHFDIPSHMLGYRFRSYIGDEGDRLPFTINMTQDYFRYERDNGIMGTGLSLEFNCDKALAKSMSIQGIPMGGKVDVDFAKNGGNISGLLYASLMHSAPPIGPKHVSEVYLNFQKLMSLSSDALYTLEFHTYRKQLWGWRPAVNCPPSLGFIITRMAEGGNPLKGPCGVGMRGQAHVRLGSFDTLLVGGRMACYAPNGAIDEGWSLTMDVIQPFLQDLDLDFTFYGFNKDSSVSSKLGLTDPPRARTFGCQARTQWRWDFLDVVSNWNGYWQLGRDALLIQMAMETTNPLWALIGLIPTLAYVRRNTSYWADLFGRIPGLLGRLIPARSDRAARERKRLELERKREEEAQRRQAALLSQETTTATAGEPTEFPEVTEEEEEALAEDPKKQQRAFDLLQKYLTKLQAEVDRRAAEKGVVVGEVAEALSALDEEIVPGFRLKDKLGWKAAKPQAAAAAAAAKAAGAKALEEEGEEEEEEELEEDEEFEEVGLEELEGMEADEDADGSWQHTGDERDSAEEEQ